MTRILWKPSAERINNSNLKLFVEIVNQIYDTDIVDYDEMYKWSIDNIPEFWEQMWDFAEIISSEPYEEVIDDVEKMPGAKWFEGAQLNFAENLLRYRDDQLALIFRGEDQVNRRLTFAELYDEVARVAKSLREMGVTVGDRVAGFMPNMPETIIAMLAATSIGALWSSCSPDFGVKGVLDRFGQIEPKVLFTANGYFFKGSPLDSMERISKILEQLPTVEKVVVVSYTEDHPDISQLPNAVSYADFKASQTGLKI